MQVNMIVANSQPTNSSIDGLHPRSFSQSGRNCECKFGPHQMTGECEQNTKSACCELHNTVDEPENSTKKTVSKMSNPATCSFHSDTCSVDQASVSDCHVKSKDVLVRRYKRSFLYLLKNDVRSRCRPACASKLQLLCIWRPHNNSYSGPSQQNGSSNTVSVSALNESTPTSLSSQRISSINRQQQSNQDAQGSSNASNAHHVNQKNYFDHRSISSAHLMPSFAKRRIGSSSQSCTGSNALPATLTSNEMLRVPNTSVKNVDHKQYLSPQRKNINKNQQLIKLAQLTNSSLIDDDKEHEREYDRESGPEPDVENNQSRCRDRDREMNINSSNLVLSNVRERRIGSGRLLPRDSWDYHSEKDSNLSSAAPGAVSFEKDLCSHSCSGSHNTSRLSLSLTGNQNVCNQRFDITHRSPTLKERNTTVKNISEYRSEPRYDSRKSFSRNDYERENLNYLRRFMSDVIGQPSNGSFNSKTGSTNVGGSISAQQPNETRRRNHRNDEPEWFSSGPTSQHDTIELRGFDELDEHDNGDNYGENSVLKGSNRKNNGNPAEDSYIKKDIGEKKGIDTSESSGDKSSRQAPSPYLQNKTPPIIIGSLKSDTNNNNQNNTYVRRTNSYIGRDEPSPSTSITVESAVDDKDAGNGINKDKKNIAASLINKPDSSSTFNIDAFLNVDPLNNSLVREQNPGHSEVVSRFTQWFVNKDENLKTFEAKTSFNKSIVNKEGTLKKSAGDIMATPLDPTDMNQTNTLMEFLQRGKRQSCINTPEQPANVKPIPSVEELEARMRKMGEENTHKKSAANIEEKQKQIPPQITESEADVVNSGLHMQHQHCISSQNSNHLSQTQDIEAFKKLLEQITPSAINVQLPPQQQSQIHRSPQFPQSMNIMASGSATHSLGAPHVVKNEELNKLMQHHQLHNRRQHLIAPTLQHSQLTQSTPTDVPGMQAMFLNPQQRYEAQMLLQGLSRGEITHHALGQQLNNPNTTPHTKEVLVAVLRESSRNTSPNVISSQPIMSPVLGQSHCPQNIPPTTPSITIPNPQQIPINHPNTLGTQQGPHHASGTNTGGLPQRIPSPRELQYHTQSIMQNALIKKKLEEQQENFRRRQEMHKQQHVQQKPLQSPSKVDMNEFGAIVGTPQQFSQNFHKKTTPSPQQQIVQNQPQNRHLNSPTPLAFTPTSVLRKMTAEKDSVNTFHPPVSTTLGENHISSSTPLAASTLVAVNVGTNNLNSNKTMHSLLMHYQQQSNPSQNVPRMILGVGNHAQQQQQNMALITGSQIQQVQPFPENQRINQSLRNNPIKWSGVIMNQISVNKPIGRPILKGSLVQPTPSPTNTSINAIHQQPQSPQAVFATKVDFQQQRTSSNQHQQQSAHPQKPSQSQTILPQHQTQSILMTQLYHQRAAFQRAQQYQMHQQFQQQTVGVNQGNGNRIVERIGCGTNNNQTMSNCGNIINYQRDGGLSPTSNQLARWFSPELLAQASAGKLPPLNMNQALSLEEFEKSIQHSSTAVNN